MNTYAQVLAVFFQQGSRQEPGKIMQDLGNPAGHNLRAGVEKKKNWDENKQLGAKRVYAKAH